MRILRVHAGRLLAVTVVAAAIAVAPGAGVARAGCRAASTQVHSFTVSNEWSKKVYKPGATTEVVVTVTRPAPEDPAGGGQPPPDGVSAPADGVRVSTVLFTGFPYPFAYGETDANGRVTLSIKLPEDARGAIDAFTRAEITHNQGGPACSDVQEYGHLEEEPAFKVR